MEDLWKVRDLGYRTNDLADKAEYDRLVKRFHEEEIACNSRNLLYGPETFPAQNADKGKEETPDLSPAKKSPS